jgi:hypothetical protein
MMIGWMDITIDNPMKAPKQDAARSGAQLNQLTSFGNR